MRNNETTGEITKSGDKHVIACEITKSCAKWKRPAQNHVIAREITKSHAKWQNCARNHEIAREAPKQYNTIQYNTIQFYLNTVKIFSLQMVS